MSKKTILLVVVLAIVLLTIVKYATGGNKQLISPGVDKAASQTAVPVPTPAYNPPQEIKYDSSTDLKQELDTINPQVLDSDFEGL